MSTDAGAGRYCLWGGWLPLLWLSRGQSFEGLDPTSTCLLPGNSPLSSRLRSVRCGLEVYFSKSRTWLLKLLSVSRLHMGPQSCSLACSCQNQTCCRPSLPSSKAMIDRAYAMPLALLLQSKVAQRRGSGRMHDVSIRLELPWLLPRMSATATSFASSRVSARTSVTRFDRPLLEC